MPYLSVLRITGTCPKCGSVTYVSLPRLKEVCLAKDCTWMSNIPPATDRANALEVARLLMYDPIRSAVSSMAYLLLRLSLDYNNDDWSPLGESVAAEVEYFLAALGSNPDSPALEYFREGLMLELSEGTYLDSKKRAVFIRGLRKFLEDLDIPDSLIELINDCVSQALLARS